MKRIISYPSFLILTIILIVSSCANIGRPGGGPIDITPPVLVKSTPGQGQTFFTKKKIELEFDEIIQVEKASEKVTVSPPQRLAPEIYTSGKKIIVELKDSLRKNTTYTVDFSDAIADNNEKNPFNNFALSFSTGATIDSMEVSGVLLNAEDLEPVTGMYVGLHRDLSDSAFRKQPFEKVTRSDANGHFTLKNVASGRYRIYALKDANSDFKFDQPGEDIAFLDSVIVPSFNYQDRQDTLWKDKVKHVVDTVRTVKGKIYYPNNLLLRSFNENFKSQYLDKAERKERNHLLITFAAPAKELPKLRPLNFPEKNWAILERSATNDTLNLWIKDSTIYKNDTLLLEANYLYTDTLRQLSPKTDTLKFTFHDIKLAPSKKDKKKDEKVKEVKPALNVEARFSGVMDIYNQMTFLTPVPLDSLDEKKFHLSQKADSVWKPVKMPPVLRDSLAIRRYSMAYKWSPGVEYRMTIDSAAMYGINGLCNNKIEQSFKVKTVEEYGGIFFRINGVNDSAYVELLSESDKPVRHEPVVKGVAEFYYVNPGSYYARLVIDKNNNGKWDAGNFERKIQPESVYYYNKGIKLRVNFDVEQTDWDIQAPLDKQKPRKLVKNKPKERVKRDAQGKEIKEPVKPEEKEFTTE